MVFVDVLRGEGLDGRMSEDDGCPAREKGYETPWEEMRHYKKEAGGDEEEEEESGG